MSTAVMVALRETRVGVVAERVAVVGNDIPARLIDFARVSVPVVVGIAAREIPFPADVVGLYVVSAPRDWILPVVARADSVFSSSFVLAVLFITF